MAQQHDKKEPTAFGLLLGELRAVLEPVAFERVCVVLESWGRQQRVTLMSPKRWQMARAKQAALLMVRQGVERALIRERLAGFGISRASCFRVMRGAEAAHAEAQAKAREQANQEARRIMDAARGRARG